MANEKAPAAARVGAAVAILDRGWGKPTQAVEANVNIFDQNDLGPESNARSPFEAPAPIDARQATQVDPRHAVVNDVGNSDTPAENPDDRWASGAARGIRIPDPIITNYINRTSRIVTFCSSCSHYFDKFIAFAPFNIPLQLLVSRSIGH
jgi:hypothetical protein